MGETVSGKHEVKSCGKAHAWCAKCRPEVAAGQRRPKPPRAQYDRPCRNCGSCDACLGLVAPEGFKVCRKCGETKPLDAFSRRLDTGGRRNQCIRCKNGELKSVRCQGCGTHFVRHDDRRVLCASCRPPLTKPCEACGKPFVGSMDQRRYCSSDCQRSTSGAQRKAVRAAARMAALQAYSAGPEPTCACCGEREPLFLALDHVNGGGGKQRRDLGGGGFMVWLRKNGYPAGFRVLCHNCNLGRQLNGGTCPHVATS